MNFFSAITPQGSSANVLFAGSGYLTRAEQYRVGALDHRECRLPDGVPSDSRDIVGAQ